jgi:hypothetical protein
MKKWLGSIVLIASLGTAAFAADGKKGPEIQVIDNKVSIQAEAVGLGRLLRLFDMATGLKSKVPAELANRNISVRFSGLTFDQAVEKIFEGVPLDYVVILGQGIVVTSASQTGPPTATAGAPFNPPPSEPQMSDEQPFFPGANGQPFPGAGQQFPGGVPGNMPPQQGGQPAMIQTPFGPIPNPRANQPPNNAPMAMPGANANQPFGLTNPTTNPGVNPSTSPFGDGSVPAFNPNPSSTPPQQPQNPFGTPNGMPLIPGQPQPIRKPPGQ